MNVQDQRRTARDDDGFTLMEVIVAMAVFAVTVTVALGIIIETAQLLRSNAQRVAAANLATAQIESARSQRALAVPNGASSRTETVGSTTYTVTQDAQYVVTGASTSACVGSGGQLTSKLVTVTVEWPDMAPVRPVRVDTLLALGKGDDDLDPTRGALAVGVVDAEDRPVPGASVTLAPGGASSTTGPDGCVVFTGLSPATYTASAVRTGAVGVTNAPAGSATASVTAGAVAKAGIVHDTARAVRLELVAPQGYAAPVGLSLRYRNTYADAGAALAPCTGAPVGCYDAASSTARHLFPAVYEFWAGECSDARAAAVTVDAKAGVTEPSGQVPLAGLQVTVTSADGSEDLLGQALVATHADDEVAGCPTGEVWDLPPTSGPDATSSAALPAGTWTISSPGATEETVTLDAGTTTVRELQEATP